MRKRDLGLLSSAHHNRAGIPAFLLGSAGMFATMYSTQAILPELSRDFAVAPSRAGLSISVVVLAVALGAWVWGPISDRVGRTRAIRLASLLLVPPTLGVAVAPTFGRARSTSARTTGPAPSALTCRGSPGRRGVGLASPCSGLLCSGLAPSRSPS